MHTCGYDISHDLLSVGLLEAGLEQPSVAAWQGPSVLQSKAQDRENSGHV